jgi:hypothetical protein
VSVLAHENPFRSERLHALRFVDVSHRARLDVRALVDRALALRRCAVIGPHGSGKTTLMLALAAELRVREIPVRYVHLSREDGRLSTAWRQFLRVRPGPHEAVLLDGGGDLRWHAFLQVAFACRHARAFIITAHHLGRLRALARTRTDVALLDSLLADLLGTVDSQLQAQAHRAFTAHRGNLREVFRDLYDRLGAR